MRDYTKLKKQAEMLKALGHPIRLCIVSGLLGKACNVSAIQECLALSQPVVSQHLAVLKKTGILHAERKGTEIIYRVEDEVVKAIVNVVCDKTKEEKQ